MRRCNCLLFAVAYWIRRGGYLCLRLSHPPLGLGVHWLWMSADRKHCLHYQPIDRAGHWWTAILHKCWYHGRLRRYDTDWKGE